MHNISNISKLSHRRTGLLYCHSSLLLQSAWQAVYNALAADGKVR